MCTCHAAALNFMTRQSRPKAPETGRRATPTEPTRKISMRLAEFACQKFDAAKARRDLPTLPCLQSAIPSRHAGKWPRMDHTEGWPRLLALGALWLGAAAALGFAFVLTLVPKWFLVWYGMLDRASPAKQVRQPSPLQLRSCRQPPRGAV